MTIPLAFIGRKASRLSSRYGYAARAALSTTTITSSDLKIVPIAEETILESSRSEEELALAIRPYYESQTPVVLRGAVKHAPAIQSWMSLDYLQDAVDPDASGYVEIGGTYGSADMERPDIPFDQYILYLKLFHERHGAVGPDIDPWINPMQDNENDAGSQPSPEELVYMAQNDLFQSLYKDIVIPSFCEDESYGIGNGKLYSAMLWLGPRGCVSPLHYDPLDNLLMQFVGRKRFTLFAGGSIENNATTSGNHNKQLSWHYAGSDGQQYNTSPINIENPLEEIHQKYPLFSDGAPPAVYCILNPGDCLFIPSKWWHHVRSLDTCASVNVWWR